MPRKPLVALNFKTYKQSFGDSCLLLTRAVATAAVSPKADFLIAPPATELCAVVRELGRESRAPFVFAQHADAYPLGAHTGSVPVESLRDAGLSGTILNHAERKIAPDAFEATLQLASASGLDVLACAKDVEEGERLARLQPWALAVEPPELIGTGRSVTSVSPQVVVNAVKRLRELSPDSRILVGAGVTTPADVRAAVDLGADGVLLASAFVLSKNPADWLAGILGALP